MEQAARARETPFTNFAEFWPFYVGAHRRKSCRMLHYAGAVAAPAVLVTALVTQQWWLLAMVPVAGYGFAWAGHFGCENNAPATFEYPLYSLIAEYKMFWYGITGRMAGEVRRLYGDEAGCGR